ncbi:MAG TPA: hypothetical protein VGP44_05070, partial [Gemmatimonadales bacterium]|nr:hypothetical protein [Gemmatimonadales bacterium]
ALSPFFACRSRLVAFGADFFPRCFDGDFGAVFFLDGRLAAALFFAALRLADFLVAAMAGSRLGVSRRRAWRQPGEGE